jgi:hypothetical protein
MPDSGRMHDFGHMPDSDWKMQLWLYARLRSEDMTLGVYPDSGRIYRLRSCITTLVDERAAYLTTSAVKDFVWLG